MEKFRGILFTLKKREPSISENDSDFYKYLIFGHYDGFDIHLVEEWYDFRPKGLMKRNLQPDLRLPYIDQYTVRALIPKNRDDLEKEGFAYSFWEGIANIACTDHSSEEENRYPYISMSVINLSENYVASKTQLSDLQKGIEKIIIKGAAAIQCPLNELHCGIFPSIGYSDFVILFQTDDLKKASDIISFLRGSSEDNDRAVISNCYSVCGIDKRFMERNALMHMENVRLSVRINLKGGISSNDFLEILKEEIESRLVKDVDMPELQELKAELPNHFYATFGNADCIILPEQPLERYLKLHTKGGIFNPEDVFFRNNIADIRTSVRVQGQEDVWEGNHRNLSTRKMEQRKEDFQKFIDRYDLFLQDNNMHIRSARAMRQIMKSYLNIAQASHGFDVERVIGRAFRFLIEAMDIYILGKDSKGTNVVEDRPKAVEALCIFKDYVGTFIADLGRSDRPFIEGNTLAHPSIGSATKLLFAYSHILKEVLKKYDKKDKFHFVVISGGCDRTKTIDLFSFADSAENLNKPILLCIPEMSLYDIQGTLFRMLHECMHFLGDRRRRERSCYIICALAGELAWDINDSKFNEEWLEKDIKRAIWGLTDEDKALLSTAMSREFCRLRQEAEQKISKLIRTRDRIRKYLCETDDTVFYSSEFKKKMTEIRFYLCGNHVKDSKSEKNVQNEIYNIFMRLEEKWYCFITEKLIWLYNEHKKKKEDLEAARVRFPLQVFRMKMQEMKLLKENSVKKDEITERFIRRYMETFTGNVDIDEEGELTSLRYQDILNVVMTAMTESFSDCSAIRILNMPPEDFILSFVYELWDVESAFPQGSDSVLRIGADLNVMYKINGSLGEELKENIWKKVRKREGQEYVYQNIDAMLKRLDVILEVYLSEPYRAMREKTEQYLKVCILKHEWYFEKLAELYSKCEFSRPEEIYEVVDELISRWMSLSR